MRPRVSARLTAMLVLLTAFALPAAAQAGTGGASPSEHQANPTMGNCAKKKSGKKKCGGKKSGPKVGDTANDDCPRGATECHIDIQLNQASPTTGGICDSFEDISSGICVGPSHGTSGWNGPGYFPQYGIQNWFSWTSQGAQRTVEYEVKANFVIVECFIRGTVPSPNSAVFNVSDAYNRVTDTHWKTASTGAAPGSKGGPLYIDYDHRVLGSSVHIFGYMVRK